MATQRTTRRYTYTDLESFPEDNFRREIIDGELIVTAAPATRHQRAVTELTVALHLWAKEHGGQVFPAPTDVFFTDTNVVEPDVIFIRAENLAKIERRFVRSAPDLVVEVSSPSTRRLELVRKLDLYERFGVPEYWYVDLDAERVEVYRLGGNRFAKPQLLGRSQVLSPPLLPGLDISVGSVLGPPEEDV